MRNTRKKIAVFAILALLSTSLLGQNCVIVYEHSHNTSGDNSSGDNGSGDVHQHVYNSLADLKADKQVGFHRHSHNGEEHFHFHTKPIEAESDNLPHAPNEPCSCEETYFDNYQVKQIAELPTVNIASQDLNEQFGKVVPTPIRFNSLVDPDFDLFNRIDRPPRYILKLLNSLSID